jgi:hypothetical protein
MADRKSASKQAPGGSRSPNKQPENKNRSGNSGNRDYYRSFVYLRYTNVQVNLLSAGKAPSKPPTSSNPPLSSKAQTRKSAHLLTPENTEN